MQRLLSTFFGIGLLAVLLLPKPSHALTVSPPDIDRMVNPGDTLLINIDLLNESKNPDSSFTVYPNLMNFGPDDKEGGNPTFIPVTEDPLGRGLAKWITVDGSPIELGSMERVSVPVSINIPEDAQPGGHYGAIMMSNAPPIMEGGKINVGQEIAVLILIRVSGDIIEEGTISEFGFVEPKVWYNSLPVDFFLRFENSGNVHIRPTGNLIIKNWMGVKTETLAVNDNFRSVLPLSIRKFEFGWANVREEGLSGLMGEIKNFAIGKYTATLLLNYGVKNQIITAERVFYVWPWRLMTMFGLVLLIVAGAVIGSKRSYDKNLIKKYERIRKRRQ